MSTIKSSSEHLTLNADGASKDIKFQANGVEKASISCSGVISSDGGSTHADNVKAKFGAGDDLQIYHDGSNSYIQDAATGSLILKSNNILLTSPGGENMMHIAQNDFVKLYHDNSPKLATTSTGVSVTGTLAATAVTGDGSGLTGIEGVPSGIISMWHGAAAAIPSGWVLCDGNNSTPNLVGKFIKGGSTAGATGGSGTTSNAGAHTHSGSNHTHSISRGTRTDGGATGHGTSGSFYYPSSGTTGSGGAGTTSSNGAHTHTIEPVYYQLCYIMKS